MNRDYLDSLDKEALIRLVLAQADTIAALTRQVAMLTARLSRLEAENVALRAENTALCEKLKLPPKTPDNRRL
jgi:regulator of replication initiation timing